ncbi:hypothetical protein [Paraburkholderia phosphatilytica]|uniref:hypothetical protein n=1 Tax=Paraburkholderia phosphatilytica TaxID=2282883 RepID=UPI000E54A4C4|nr:hypothetical protein [Paraburkholderia phosphatilytica]
MNLQDNEQMYHAASQRGPIKQEWLTAHTPPKPLWQQQIEDGLGRFVVGLVPGVNLLTPWIVPAKSLPQEWRDGIDFMSGVLGGMMGEAGPEIVGGLAGRMGKLDKAQDELHAHPELRQDADGLRVKDDGPAALHDAGATPHTPGSTYGAGGSAVPAGKALDVPENYATSPAGALKPDPNHPGVWQSPDGLANYIQQDGKTYRVNWSQYRNGWEIRDSVNGSKPTYPAEMGSDGNWKTYANDLGKGGAPPSNYTPELGRQIYTRHQNGETYEQIAQSLGLARSTARLYAHHYANAGNLPIGEVRLQYTPELGEQAYNRHVNGESFRRIGQDLDLSHTTARRYAEQYAKANNLPFGTARWRYTIPLGHEIYTRHQQGEDFKAIAEDLGMNRDTARIYAKQYQAESGALGRPGPSGAAGPSGMSGQAGSSQAAGHPDPRAAGEGGFESLSPEAQQRVDSWIRGEIPAPPELVQLVQRVSGGHWTVVDLYNFMKHRALVPLDKQAQIAAWLRQ